MNEAMAAAVALAFAVVARFVAHADCGHPPDAFRPLDAILAIAVAAFVFLQLSWIVPLWLGRNFYAPL